MRPSESTLPNGKSLSCRNCCLRKLSCCRNRPWLEYCTLGLLAGDGCVAKHHLGKRGLFAYVTFSYQLAAELSAIRATRRMCKRRQAGSLGRAGGEEGSRDKP